MTADSRGAAERQGQLTLRSGLLSVLGVAVCFGLIAVVENWPHPRPQALAWLDAAALFGLASIAVGLLTVGLRPLRQAGPLPCLALVAVGLVLLNALRWRAGVFWQQFDLELPVSTQLAVQPACVAPLLLLPLATLCVEWIGGELALRRRRHAVVIRLGCAWMLACSLAWLRPFWALLQNL